MDECKPGSVFTSATLAFTSILPSQAHLWSLCTTLQVLLSKDAQLAESLPIDPLDLAREAAALDTEKAELMARLQQIEARQVEITRRLRSSDGGGTNGAQVTFLASDSFYGVTVIEIAKALIKARSFMSSRSFEVADGRG